MQENLSSIGNLCALSRDTNGYLVQLKKVIYKTARIKYQGYQKKLLILCSVIDLTPNQPTPLLIFLLVFCNSEM